MVNEINKGPSQENLALGERLLASQRQLLEMQEEHRQLLQEMEVLRQRATTLSQLHDQQFGHMDQHRSGGSLTQATNANTTTQQTNATASGASEHVEQETTTTTTATSTDAVEQTSNLNSCTNNTQSASPVSAMYTPENDEDDVDPETAEYLQKKLAEIAQLKARFKRVQSIMNTTDMIEGHIASKTEGTKSSDATTTALESAMDKLHMAKSLLEVQSHHVTSSTTSPSQPISKSNEEDLAVKNDPTKYDDEQTLNAYAPSQTPNEELLSAMMNMFTDFTADLRSQADDLRAERDRLRALKEDLLRRKRQS